MSNVNSASKLAAEISGMMENFLVRRCSEIEALLREREFLKIRIEELEKQKQDLLEYHESEMIRWKAICSEGTQKENQAKAIEWGKEEKEMETKLENGLNEGPENKNPIKEQKEEGKGEGKEEKKEEVEEKEEEGKDETN